jgi:hypothetical protein
MATGQAVLCKNGEPWQTFASNSLSCPDVRVIYQDRRGDLWFGTFGGGLNRLRNGTFTAYKTERGDHNNRCWWIYEDADGVFWIGSEDGLNRFVPPDDAEEQGNHNPKAQPPATGRNRFFTFTKEQGLPDNVINNIQEDDFGCLWLSGLRGIYRVSREQLNAVAAGRLSTVTCTIFGETDGMLSSECNGGDNQPAGCKDRLGRIWFPTVQGVVMIDPKLARSAGDPPPVLVEQVKANGQVVFGDDLESSAPQRSKLPRSDFAPYRLPPGTARAIEIFYTANTFADPGRIRFKYRLEGYDRDWLWDEQNRRTVSYANLKPGRYTFRVTACDSHGCWNEQGAQFAFYIEPFFWQTWPFYIAIAALALATAMGLHHQRVARVRRVERLEQERSLADERARIARDLHDDLGASLSALSLFEKRGRP